MTVASRVDEDSIKTAAAERSGGAADLALVLATAKAAAVSTSYPYSYVLGADQILECGGTLFDKPRSLQQARQQLLQLRGCRHRLVNGLVILKSGQTVWSHTETATLTMRDFSERFLDSYLDTVGEQVLSSVGGYQLEGPGSQLFESVDGDYFSILGLPLLPLLAYLRHIHILEQ